MRRNRIGGACGLLALLCGAWICAAQNKIAQAALKLQTQQETKPQSKMNTKQTTREVIDEAGRHVAVPVEVHRIVALAPNLAEIVYALGAQDRLVGVSNYSDSPSEAKSKPHVGMPMNPNLEAVVAAHPDIVLMTTEGNRRETADELARLGIAAYTTNPHSVESTLESIEHIGGVIGAAEQAESVVANLRQRLDALKSRLGSVSVARVFFVVGEHPLISLGEHTFIADALRYAGAQSVVHAKQDWPQISLEEVVRLNPDYVVFASSDSGDEESQTNRLAELRSEAGWRELAAVRDGRVVVVSDEIDLPAPGLVDAIEKLARQLHTDVFEDAARCASPRASLTPEERGRFLAPTPALLLRANQERPEFRMTNREFRYTEHLIAQLCESASANPHPEAIACGR
ncbi:MAG TPA: helical backbone metal receptor [Candidatus Acidoferrales bacterium]|nr:helical backbone metal receptor [Candidatus Acidoferrales bacterium]